LSKPRPRFTPARWILLLYMAGYYPFLALACFGAGWIATF
jgi:hypothetical protein